MLEFLEQHVSFDVAASFRRSHFGYKYVIVVALPLDILQNQLLPIVFVLKSLKLRLQIIDFVELIYLAFLHDLIQYQYMAIQRFNLFIDLSRSFLEIFVLLSQMLDYDAFLRLLTIILVVENDLDHILVDLNVLMAFLQLQSQPLVLLLQIFHLMTVFPLQDVVVLIHDVIIIKIKVVLAWLLRIITRLVHHLQMRTARPEETFSAAAVGVATGLLPARDILFLLPFLLLLLLLLLVRRLKQEPYLSLRQWPSGGQPILLL